MQEKEQLQVNRSQSQGDSIRKKIVQNEVRWKNFSDLLSNNLKNIVEKSQLSQPAIIKQEDPVPISACTPPKAVGPQFIIFFRRPLAFFDLLIPGNLGNIPRIPDFYFNCVKIGRPRPDPDDPGDVLTVPDIDFYLCFDMRFKQVWNLVSLGIGDLSSSLGLAPAEKLTLEFFTSQRKYFEQNKLDSVEEITSSESTIFDKDVVDVLRSSTSSSKWNVDGNFNVSIKQIFSFGFGGGGGGSTETVAKESVQHISETTVKSAHSLKTMHKIEVKGISEGLVTNRMTRVIQNPYYDRTISLNVYSMLKQYSVLTQLTEIRPALIIKVKNLVFDDLFITSNVDFLNEKLIDLSLSDELPAAVDAAKPIPLPDKYNELLALCKKALELLFDKDNIFNVPPLNIDSSAYDPPSANSVELAMDPLWVNRFNTGLEPQDSLRRSAFQGARGWTDRGVGNESNSILKFYSILGFLYSVYKDLKTRPNDFDANAIALAFTIRQEIDKYWDKDALTEAEFKHINSLIFPYDDYHESFLSEIYRRLSGFKSLVRGIGDNLAKDVSDYWALKLKKDYAARDRLLHHLNCHKNYYIQEYLAYNAKKTRNQDIIDFVNQVIDSLGRPGLLTPAPEIFRALFDVERSFIDRQEIVIPAFRPLYEKDGVILVPPITSPLQQPTTSGGTTTDAPKLTKIILDDYKQVDNIEVPTEAIHLEVVAGTCVLENVPPPIEKSIDLSIKDAAVKISGP